MSQLRATLPDLGPLFGSAPSVVLVVDAFGLVTYANRGPRGEAPDTIQGSEVALLFPSSAADTVREAVRAGALEGRAFVAETGDVGSTGTRSWWRIEASPLPESHVLLVISDATAHRHELERLRRSESLLVDAQGIAHMGTWEWDVSQPRAQWSAELYRIYGLTPEEYAPSYEGYLQMVHPDDRARVMAVTEAVFKEHKPYSHDERIFRKDGEMRWLHTWAVPVLDESGRLVRLLGVCQDVTESKRAESAMRAQMMTRSLARRLLHDLIRQARVSEHVVRELGRGLAKERTLGMPEEYAATFEDMGFGKLRYESERGGRYVFTATDLLERRSEAPLPTCFLTLGYLEGAVGAILGRPALGTEMRCQSAGHSECRFVVQ